MSDRALRDLLEAAEAKGHALEQERDGLALEVKRLQAKLEAAHAEADRLSQLLMRRTLNPKGQKSDFGVEQAKKLVEFLRRSRG